LAPETAAIAAAVSRRDCLCPRGNGGQGFHRISRYRPQKTAIFIAIDSFFPHFLRQTSRNAVAHILIVDDRGVELGRIIQGRYALAAFI